MAEALTAHASKLRSSLISEVQPFLLQYPPSLFSPLNSCNVTPFLKSLWTTTYYLLKRHPAYWEWVSTLTSNSRVSPHVNIFKDFPQQTNIIFLQYFFILNKRLCHCRQTFLNTMLKSPLPPPSKILKSGFIIQFCMKPVRMNVS